MARGASLLAGIPVPQLELTAAALPQPWLGSVGFKC